MIFVHAFLTLFFEIIVPVLLIYLFIKCASKIHSYFGGKLH